MGSFIGGIFIEKEKIIGEKKVDNIKMTRDGYIVKKIEVSAVYLKDGKATGEETLIAVPSKLANSTRKKIIDLAQKEVDKMNKLITNKTEMWCLA